MDHESPHNRSSTPLKAARLTDLWHLGPSEVIVLVGAGGKSSVMEALARDYEEEGLRVVLTTTTKVRSPGRRPLLIADDVGSLVEAVAGRVAAGGLSPVVGRRLTGDGKVDGIPVEWVAALRDAPGVGAVVVEADGSLGLPVKAPAEWEPVIPGCASLVISVVGLDSQGVPIDERHVHRPGLLAERLGVAVGSPLAPRHVLRAAAWYESEAPPLARFLILLNKADVSAPEPGLLEACAESGLEVWCGAAGASAGGLRHGADGPFSGVMRRLDPGGSRSPAGEPSVIVLAAGLGSRMSGPKVTAPFGDSTVVGHVLRAVLATAGTDRVVVVTGADSDVVTSIVEREKDRRAIAGGGCPPIRVVRNPRPEEGMASSLLCGVGALHRPASLLVLLGDQPLVRAETLADILRAAGGAQRAAPPGLAGGHGGGVRPPVLLHRSLVPRILELRGDEGARRLLGAHADSAICVPAEPEEAIDVDLPADLERARTILAQREGRRLR